MPNIAYVLKEEIVRLSRRESRSQVDSTRKATIRHRREIAALKRDMAQLERQVALLSRKSVGAQAVVAADTNGKSARFSAKDHTIYSAVPSAAWSRLKWRNSSTLSDRGLRYWHYWTPIARFIL